MINLVVKTRSGTVVTIPEWGTGINADPVLLPKPASSFTSLYSETMKDSSVTGSARTDLDAVDQFLADPTNRGDFHKALQKSHESIGDAGLADFRVDRLRTTYVPWSGQFSGMTPGGSVTNTAMRDFMVRSSNIASSFPSLPEYSAPSAGLLKDLGQRGYLQALPNRTQVELGTALAEIAVNPAQALTIPGSAIARRWASQPTRSRRQIISEARRRHKRLRGLSKEDAAAAASDYLAYIFGAAPNIQVMDELADQLTRSRKIAEAVARQGWRRTRRRRVIRSVSDSVSVTQHGSWLHQATGNSWMLTGPLTKTTTVSQDVWWSGSFRMPTSDTDSWLDQCSEFFERLDLIAGLGVDIKMAWDLIPFSFVVDWFSNTGSYIENREVIRDYNIVCEYGYVMCHTRTTHQGKATGFIQKYPQSSTSQTYYGTAGASCSFTRLSEVKQRAACSSFGFDTDFSALNPYQWSALTALGLVSAAGVKPRVRT